MGKMGFFVHSRDSMSYLAGGSISIWVEKDHWLRTRRSSGMPLRRKCEVSVDAVGGIGLR